MYKKKSIKYLKRKIFKRKKYKKGSTCYSHIHARRVHIFLARIVCSSINSYQAGAQSKDALLLSATVNRLRSLIKGTHAKASCIPRRRVARKRSRRLSRLQQRSHARNRLRSSHSWDPTYLVDGCRWQSERSRCVAMRCGSRCERDCGRRRVR